MGTARSWLEPKWPRSTFNPTSTYVHSHLLLVSHRYALLRPSKTVSCVPPTTTPVLRLPCAGSLHSVRFAPLQSSGSTEPNLACFAHRHALAAVRVTGSPSKNSGKQEASSIDVRVIVLRVRGEATRRPMALLQHMEISGHSRTPLEDAQPIAPSHAVRCNVLSVI